MEPYVRTDGSVVGDSLTPAPPQDWSPAAGRGTRGSFRVRARLARQYGDRWAEFSKAERDGLVAVALEHERGRRQ